MKNNLFCLAIILLVAAGASGCSKAATGKIEKSVLFAKTALEEVNHNPVARLSFGNIMESSGSPVTYLAANTDGASDLVPFLYGGPAQPWSVVIRNGDSEGQFIIEGYGADLKKPVRMETVAVSWKPTPPPSR